MDVASAVLRKEYLTGIPSAPRSYMPANTASLHQETGVAESSIYCGLEDTFKVQSSWPVIGLHR